MKLTSLPLIGPALAAILGSESSSKENLSSTRLRQDAPPLPPVSNKARWAPGRPTRNQSSFGSSVRNIVRRSSNQLGYSGYGLMTPRQLEAEVGWPNIINTPRRALRRTGLSLEYRGRKSVGYRFNRSIVFPFRTQVG